MRVPLLVLTGFLGAGKTTLLNALLASRAAGAAQGEGTKLGIVVNELGEVGIDGALLGQAGQGATRQIELPGGCVCCVLGDDLDRTLIELVDANPGLDAIVLETTGVAEPLPIAWALDRAPVCDRVRLAAVVTLVDAMHFRSSRPVSVAVDAQVAYADVVLVTKAPLAGAAETAEVLSAIRTLASRALVRIGDTAEHVAWLEQVLADPAIDRLPAPAHASPHGQDPGHIHDEHCRHLDTGPVHGIDSVWSPAHGVYDLEELEDALGELPPNYVRIKGILRATDERGGAPVRGWYVVHRVGLRVSSEPVAAPDLEQGRIVALGPAVASDELARTLGRAMVVEDA